MTDYLRTPFQGVWNIVRFNWHFYVAAAGGALALVLAGLVWPPLRAYTPLLLLALLVPVAGSLAVSAYVYDCSDLYRLTWLQAPVPTNARLLTVNAGFDEISAPLQDKYAPCQVQAVDFYDPARHTEVSIKRARRAYPPFPGTRPVDTRAPLPLPDNSIDLGFAFLAAHEIRNTDERAAFFQELRRVLKPAGRVVVTEHLRDTANFLAYTVGFFHFHSRRAWLATFRQAGFHLEQEIKITPFVTTFLLSKNGTAA